MNLQNTSNPSNGISARVFPFLLSQMVLLDQSARRYIDSILCDFDVSLSRLRLVARVEDIVSETHDCKSFWLRVPARWQGFNAGQFVQVSVEINGVRMQRCYSISSSQEEWRQQGLIRLTVKRVEGGKVSNHLHDQLRVGDRLVISEAMGEFVLAPQSPPVKALFLAAGSGITPILSMLTRLSESAVEMDAVLMYYSRSRADVIFASHLQQLADITPGLQVFVYCSEEDGQCSTAHLAACCPDAASRDVYLCGPSGFMDSVKGLLSAANVDIETVRSESFGGATPALDLAGFEGEVAVSFERSHRQVSGSKGQTVLELAEKAGLQPKYGCRMGVCHECACEKGEGDFVHKLSGKSIPDTQHIIQACMAVPVGPVSIKSL